MQAYVEAAYATCIGRVAEEAETLLFSMGFNSLRYLYCSVVLCGYRNNANDGGGGHDAVGEPESD